MALIDKAARSASVTAVEDSRLLAIKRRDFFDMIRKDHDVAVKLLWSFLGVLAKRLRTTSHELGQAREMLAAEDMTDEIAPSATSAGALMGEKSPISEMLEIIDKKLPTEPPPPDSVTLEMERPTIADLDAALAAQRDEEDEEDE